MVVLEWSDISNGNPSASSPNPCKRIKVAGRPASLSVVSRMEGGFWSMAYRNGSEFNLAPGDRGPRHTAPVVL